VPTSLYIQGFALAITILLGTVGTYWTLTASATYGQGSAITLAFQSFLASLGFLVLNGGPFPTPGASPWQADVLVIVGRLSGTLFFSYTAFLGIKALFSERLQLWSVLRRADREGPSGSRRYVIVCGLGEKGFELGRNLLKAGQDVVAIDVDEDNPRARELSDLGAVVLCEDATRYRALGHRAQAHLASEVFVNCGDDQTNVRVAVTLARWVAERLDESETDSEGPIICHAHVGARNMQRFLQGQLGDQSNPRLHMYDAANATAREVLRRRPVDRFGSDLDAGRTHVAILGWSELSLALVSQLCHTMHYPDRQDRIVTVACNNPEVAKTELFDHYSALDPGRWDQESVGSFVADVFPEVSFVELPADMDLLLSDRFALYDRLDPKDTLTIFVSNDDAFPSSSAVSTMLPRLEALDDQYGTGIEIHYYVDGADPKDHLGRPPRFGVESDTIDVKPFRAFVDECTPETVRGERRDRTAKRIALFFHLRYNFDPSAKRPTAADRTIRAHTPFDEPSNRGYGYDELVSHWDRMDESDLKKAAEIVWRHLSESARDANRHAADHVLVKRRCRDALRRVVDDEAIVRMLSEVEHRRWCAEKLLDGWEPLSGEHAERWRSEMAYQRAMRQQKYHLDIRPLDELERSHPGEVEKDVSLVRFQLEHL